MSNKVYVIKALKKSTWYYYRDHEEPYKPEWGQDLYFARKFKSRSGAEEFLNEMVKVEHWGGYFSIDRYYLSR